MSALNTAVSHLLSVVFPTSCPACGAILGQAFPPGICSSCHSRLTPWEGPICDACGIPLASTAAEFSPGWRCGPCRAEAYHFDLARSYGPYSDPLRKLILELKFRRRARWGPRLGELLAGVWQQVARRVADPAALIVPVPLHPARQREREFNQAELLAKGFWRRLKQTGCAGPMRMESSLLRRARAAPPQSGLSRPARLENVRGAFEVHEPARLRGRAIVLIDDVMTTGATASACAATLKRAGASQVIVLTLARATPQFPDGLRLVGAADYTDGADLRQE